MTPRSQVCLEKSLGMNAPQLLELRAAKNAAWKLLQKCVKSVTDQRDYVDSMNSDPELAEDLGRAALKARLDEAGRLEVVHTHSHIYTHG